LKFLSYINKKEKDFKEFDIKGSNLIFFSFFIGLNVKFFVEGKKIKIFSRERYHEHITP